MARFLSPRELMQLLAVPVPLLDRSVPLPISDPDPDPGLFGPGSVTWRVLGEPLLILGGARALLMQAAHPHVAQGAIDHSAYATDPFGRLMRTFEWSATVSFGTTAEAGAVCDRVTRLHGRVKGDLPRGHGTSAVRGGSHYDANAPDLLLWVHATFVDSLLVSHDRLVGGLTEADRDTFVAEWEVVGRLMGVRPELFWPDYAALRGYVDAQLASFARPGPGSLLVAETILHPELPSAALRPVFDMLSFASLGFLPPALRDAYAIPWTPTREAAHRSLCLLLRTARAGVPRRLRVAPIHEFAMARSRGKLIDSAA